MSTPLAADDEYVVSYVHRGKKLVVLYMDHQDNRAMALESASRTAMADGVSNLRVHRRPRTEWEPVEWRRKGED